MTLDAVVFYVLAAIAVLSGIQVVVNRSPLYCALSLILTLVSLALVFVQLNAGFLGAVQIVVYAGAIVVLFVFIIMLLNLTDATSRELVGVPGKALGVLVLGAIFFAMYSALRPAVAEQFGPKVEGFGTVQSVGTLLFQEYVIPFEITGILLLSAILGSIVLARRKP